MGGRSKAPAPDPRIGEAAMLSAETGRQYLEYMRELGDISTAWAQEDRERYQTVFQPIEDVIVADAWSWDTPQRRLERSQQAEADVLTGVTAAREADQRRLTAMGVAPDSGRAAAMGSANNLREGLARAGARNTATRQVEAEGDARMLQAAALGRGLQVNPATSLGLGGNLTGAGFEGQMAGYGQMGDMLTNDWKMRMDQWQADQANSAGLWGGIGQIAGMFAYPMIASSKDYKEDRTAPEASPLDAVRDMPVQEWNYREGVGDGGAERHIGPMAEDYQRATGRGNGRMISLPDMVGTTMGAVQELAAKVDRIEAAIGRTIRPPAQMRAA